MDFESPIGASAILLQELPNLKQSRQDDFGRRSWEREFEETDRQFIKKGSGEAPSPWEWREVRCLVARQE
jgi:hypothetical protein